MGLTDKQVRFCQEYTIDFNATQAAIRAGYSEDTAGSIGSENLTKPEIEAYVSRLKEDAANALKITRERVLNELAKIAFFDIRKIHTVDGAIMSVRDFDDDSAGAVAGIEVYEEKINGDDNETITIGQVKKLKIADKRAALDSISKMMGYNEPDKVKYEGGVQIIQIPDNGRNKDNQSATGVPN